MTPTREAVEATATWIEGPPTCEGLFFIRLEDQGGWPWATVVEVAEMAEEMKPGAKRRLAIVGTTANWQIPEAGLPIADIWNLTDHIPIPQPSMDRKEETP